jgi:hypothetical protein
MQKQNRRNFVKSTAATTLAFNLLPDTARGANSRVALGCVGIGGKGAQDSRGVADAGAEMVAFCDVASPSNPKLARKKNKSDLVNKFPDAKIFEDYREMIRSTISMRSPFPPRTIPTSTQRSPHCKRSATFTARSP